MGGRTRPGISRCRDFSASEVQVCRPVATLRLNGSQPQRADDVALTKGHVDLAQNPSQAFS
jgi:hypothetical protein